MASDSKQQERQHTACQQWVPPGSLQLAMSYIPYRGTSQVPDPSAGSRTGLRSFAMVYIASHGPACRLPPPAAAATGSRTNLRACCCRTSQRRINTAAECRVLRTWGSPAAGSISSLASLRSCAAWLLAPPCRAPGGSRAGPAAEATASPCAAPPLSTPMPAPLLAVLLPLAVPRGSAGCMMEEAASCSAVAALCRRWGVQLAPCAAEAPPQLRCKKIVQYLSHFHREKNKAIVRGSCEACTASRCAQLGASQTQTPGPSSHCMSAQQQSLQYRIGEHTTAVLAGRRCTCRSWKARGALG